MYKYGLCQIGWVIGGLLLCVTAAQAKETITWATLHFPPWMILNGDSKGTGVWDALQAELVAKLPEYDHRMVEMKNVRYEELAKQQEKVCKVYYFKTPERESIFYYSHPSVVFLSNQVLMRSEKAKALGNPSSISLEQLVADSRFDGTFIDGRSYGKPIDEIILKNQGKAHLHSRVMDNQSLFEFLRLGRTDYILEFPAVRSFFELDLDIHPEVVNITIQEAIPYNVTYVTCVRNDWGKRIIGRVNQILKYYVPTRTHRVVTLRWYQPEDQRRLSKYFDEILIGTSKPGRELNNP